MIDKEVLMRSASGERISEFVKNAYACLGDAEAARMLCAAEMEWLYAHYTVLSVHTLLTTYHHALREAGVAAPYDEWLREPKAQVRTNRHDKGFKIAQRLNDKRPLTDIDALLAQGVSLLESPAYSCLTLGVALLTGRRPYEVLVTASFTRVPETSYALVFAGQAKTRERGAIAPYRIPILAHADLILDACTRLRHTFDGSPYRPDATWTNHLRTSAALQQRVGKTLKEACTRYFHAYIPDVSPYDLRRVYVVIAHHRFALPKQDLNAYIPTILGHGDTDTTTANSYKDFYLA
jgi:hypothetical protein